MPQPIDDYLAELPPKQRLVLQRLRAAIHAAAPGAEECLSYGMPAFRLGGKLIAGFAASARHCAFHPMSGSTIGSLAKELSEYDTSKGALRFSPERGLPAALVRKLVRTRMAELAEAPGRKKPTVSTASAAKGTSARQRHDAGRGATSKLRS
jgi:uncharacterized protein YdhG (YjbR/CyaY superfamily)